jgi:soluble lytic murein transglycosylase-like protein
MVEYQTINNHRVPIEIIRQVAIEKNIDPVLLAAIVMVESSGNTNAKHFEQRYRLNSFLISQAKLNSVQFGHSFHLELKNTQTAWGLMQIVGGTARSMLHFKGPLPKLLDARVNLRLGSDFILLLKSKYKRKTDVISAYNQGQPFKYPNGKYKNQEYVNKVLRMKERIALWF